jgi:hypothetical protein
MGRLDGTHTDIGKGNQKDCIVCRKYGNRVRTNFFCQRFNVGLCIISCYDRYHTVEDF